jgi:hypothetical protein
LALLEPLRVAVIPDDTHEDEAVMPKIMIDVTMEQFAMLAMLAMRANKPPDAEVTPADIIEKWIPIHLGLPCPECENPREISREGSYTLDDGETWHSAFQESVLIQRCVTTGCSLRGKIEAVDMYTLEPKHKEDE